MYVLAYEVPYEGQSVLGVYGSADSALAAVRRYTERDPRSPFYADLVIRRIELDVDAEMEAGEVVWRWCYDGE